MATPTYTDAELEAITLLLRTDVVELEMGAENWDLSEDTEFVLWGAINKAKKADLQPAAH